MLMRSWGVIIAFLFLAAGCESEKDQFSGLSDLVAERNEVRKIIAKETAQKKKKDAVSLSRDNGGTQMEQKKTSEGNLSSGVLYEKKIEVIDSQSGTSLAKGVAFLNKEGRIVRIRIQKK